MKTMIQAELPPELTARALTFVKDGWASDFNELLADALPRFLESHSARLRESMVVSDVQWGCMATTDQPTPLVVCDAGRNLTT